MCIGTLESPVAERDRLWMNVTGEESVASERALARCLVGAGARSVTKQRLRQFEKIGNAVVCSIDQK